MNFLTYHSDPNIYSRAPFFRATLEYRSNFQKKHGSSSPDQQRLQTIRENSVLSIFESVAGFLNLLLGFRSIFNMSYWLKYLFYGTNFQGDSRKRVKLSENIWFEPSRSATASNDPGKLRFVDFWIWSWDLGQFFNISCRPKYRFSGTNFQGDSRI